MKKLIIRLICIMLVFIMMGFCGGCNNTEKVKIERSGIDPSLINGKRVGKEVFLSAISNTPLFSDSGASFTIEKFYARETNIQRNIKEQYEIIKIETKITEDSEQPNVISCEYLSFNEKDDGVVLKTLRKTEVNEDYFMNWEEMYPKSYDKTKVSPFTKVRIILLNGTEFESNWFLHQFARNCDNNDLKRELALQKHIQII